MRRVVRVTPMESRLQHEAVDTLQRRAFDDLETFAERSRRADGPPRCSRGCRPRSKRGVVYSSSSPWVVTLLILYFGRAAGHRTKRRAAFSHRATCCRSRQPGRCRLEVKAAPATCSRRRAARRIDSSKPNSPVANLRNRRRTRRRSACACCARHGPVGPGAGQPRRIERRERAALAVTTIRA